MLVYLNDIPKEFGGATYFPHLNIKIQPKKNSALYFKNVLKNQKGDQNTYHGGEALRTNHTEKWAMNIWIRHLLKLKD